MNIMTVTMIFLAIAMIGLGLYLIISYLVRPTLSRLIKTMK